METLSYPDISSFAGPIYIAVILAEIALVIRFGKSGDYEANDTVTSILMGMGNVVSGLLVKGSMFAGTVAVGLWAYQYRLFDLGVSWWVFLLAFLLDDFVFYWSHRWQHLIRWGWANHVVHHSSQHYNFSTSLRQPWFSFFSGFFVLTLPMAFLGVHPAITAFVGSLNLFYQFFLHTEVVRRLPGPIELIFNTPSHHRVHHGKNPKYLDANYAGVLIIWDRIFGTFIPEDDHEPVSYGLVKDIGTYNPLRVASHEYVAILRDIFRPGLTWRDRWGYFWGRPGWSHDGSRMTSQQIKAAQERASMPAE